MPHLPEIISELSQNCLYLKALKQARTLYAITYNDLKNLSPYSVFQLLKKFNSRLEGDFGGASNDISNCQTFEQECWHPSQYKLFSWMSVCYAFTINKPISEFKSHNKEFMINIFRNKKMTFIEYHLLCLQKQSKSKRQVWTPEERELLQTLMKEERFKGRWSDISYHLYCKSDKQFFRTAHSCREMWFNHLNPVVSHTKWTIQEDIQLFKLAFEFGTKWARISKAMQGVRTEHMVKNRFNAISKRYQSRFQRCSIKKMINLILSVLEKRSLIQKEGGDDSCDKYDEVDSFQVNSNQKNSSIMEEEQEEEEDQDEEFNAGKKQKTEEKSCSKTPQLKKEEKEVQNFQFYTIKDIVKAQQFDLKECQQQNNCEEQAECDCQYEGIKMQTIECEGSLAEWVETNGRNVQLVDYTDFYPEYKPTIFSGTNS